VKRVVYLTVAIPLFAVSPDLSAQDYGRRDTDFEITITERNEFPPGYDAGLESTALYPCTGYDIRAGVSWNRDTLTIDIGGFRSPTPCITLSAPATGSVYLGDIGQGSYILRIRYRGDVDLHRVRITQDRVQVRGIRSEFTSIRWK
jgi:hypothetical protein